MNKRQLVIDIASLYFSTFLSCIPSGILAVLISVKVAEQVKDDLLISIIFTTQTLAGILFAKYIPKFAKKFGLIKSIHIANIIAATTSILFFFYISYFIWIAITFIFGIAIFSFIVIRQSMLLDVAPQKHRAVIASTSSMFVALGISAGAMIIKLINSSGFEMHIIAAIFFMISSIPMLFIKGINCEVKKVKRIGILRYIYNSPKIMFGGFSFNYANSSIQSFLVIYGIKTGMTTPQASLLFATFLFGTIFSIPMGFITDRINRRFIMLTCTIISLFLSILIPLQTNISVTSTLLFLMFGFSIGIKLPALILINEKYKPTQRLAVVSAFNKMCLIGNICGISATGLFMKFYGPEGLWTSVITILTIYLSFSILNYILKIITGKKVIGKFIVQNN